MRKLILPLCLKEEIEREALEGYPYEICGVLVGVSEGEQRIVKELHPLPNRSDEDKKRRFRINPLDFYHIEKQADESGLRVLGFYHSHPDHPPRPSQTDLQYAWPEFSYVIQSVTKDEPKDLRSWYLSNTNGAKEFIEEEIENDDQCAHSHTVEKVH